MITIWRLASVTEWDHWCPRMTWVTPDTALLVAVSTINRIDITFQVVIVCSDIMLCTHLTSHFNCQHHCGASSASSFEWKQMILFRIFETLTQSINIDLCCVYSVKPIDWLEMPGRVKFMLHDDVLKQKAHPSASRLTSTSTEWDSQLNFDVSSGWLN